MKNKPADIPYCGVDIDKIKNARPKLRQEVLQKYRDYQYKRAEIYYKKDILKLPSPWTDDPILRKYQFTNVKREFDKESKILLNNVIYNEKCSLTNALLNSAFIRAYYTKAFILNNLKEGFIDFSNSSEEYMSYLVDRLPENVTGAAYLVGGCRKGAFIEMKRNGENKVKTLVRFLQQNTKNFEDSFINIDSPIQVLNCNILGFRKKFIPYQIIMDLGYHKEFKFSNNEFVLSGPGCSLGISFLCEDMGGLNDEEFMFWFRDNISSLIDFNPKEFLHFCDEDNQNWSVNDIENSFCEFGKYIKLEKLQNENVRCRQRCYKSAQENTIDDF